MCETASHNVVVADSTQQPAAEPARALALVLAPRPPAEKLLDQP